MALKMFVFCASIILVLMVTWGTDATVIRREAPSDASQTIDDAVSSIKTSFNDLMKNLQDNAMFHNATEALKELRDKVQAQGSDLLEKLQKVEKTN